MELWDLFDENRRPLNKIHDRQEPMKKGEYHVFADIWTVNENNEILLTLRHPDKKVYPNFWENTMGAIQSGETSRSGAARELFEETGITADESELFYLGTIRTDSFFVDTYIIRKNVDLSEIVLQDGETADALWVTLEKLDEMIEQAVAAPPLGIRLANIREGFLDFLYRR